MENLGDVVTKRAVAPIVRTFPPPQKEVFCEPMPKPWVETRRIKG